MHPCPISLYKILSFIYINAQVLSLFEIALTKQKNILIVIIDFNKNTYYLIAIFCSVTDISPKII